MSDRAAPSRPPGPPEEAFWDRYNARSEFPLSTVLSVLLHVAAAALIVFVVFRLMDRGEDRAAVPIKMIDVDGGLEESGDGKLGGQGVPEPLAEDNANPLKAMMDALPDPKVLPEVTADIREKLRIEDPTADLPIAAANAPAYATVKEALRDKLLGLGAKKGEGGPAGSGASALPGDGNGGKGADSSRARSLRWVLRFRTASGRDYLDQLRAMGAVILVPLPPNEAECELFEDLNDPSRHRTATDADIKRLGGQLRFGDSRRESVRQVAQTLGLAFTPRSFFAYFPKGLEEELSRKETGYRNRRAEDIDETTFQVTVRGGGYDVVVFDQTARR